MKFPAPRWSLSLVAALVAGTLIGRYALPSRVASSPERRDSGLGENGAASNAPSPALAGLPLAAQSLAPFTGTADDLLKEAAKAGDHSSVQLRLALLLSGTPAGEIARIVGTRTWLLNGDWKEPAVFGALVRRWAETDPAAALAWGDAQTDRVRRSLRSQVIEIWARTDSEKALAYARKISDRNERAGALGMIAAAVAREDPRAALRILDAAGQSPNTSPYHGMFSAWASTDPAAAHAAALGLPSGNQRNTALNAVMSAWAQVDPEAAHEAALAIPDATLQRQSLQWVLNTWANSDPSSAFQAAQSLTNARTRRDTIHSLFSTWAQNDPVAASVAYESVAVHERGSISYYVAHHWAEKDPRAAMSWAKSLSNRSQSDNAIRSVFQQWAQSDGPAAAAAIDRLPASARSSGLNEIASQWASYDRDAALQWARNLERPQDRMRALTSCLARFDLADTETISGLLAEIPVGKARTDLITSIASSQSYNDPEGTLAWLRTLHPDDLAGALRDNGALGSLAQSMPGAAAELLLTVPAGVPNSDLWRRVGAGFAKEDPAAALAWAESIEAPGNRNSALKAVLESWAEADPRAALERARSLTESGGRDEAVQSVLSTWADQNPQALLDWAASARGDERIQALIQSSAKLAPDNPAASAEVVGTLLHQSPGGAVSSAMGNAVANVATAWFQQDIGKACNWAITLPPGAAQEKAIDAIASNWTNNDPVAASQWIQQLPQGTPRDHAVNQLVNGIAESDPHSAFVWAASIGSESMQSSGIRLAFSQLQNLDPAAARSAVEQSPLPQNLRQSLLGQLDANGK